MAACRFRSSSAARATAAATLATLTIAWFLIAVRPAAADIDAEQVRASIDRAIVYLKREQTPRGFWNEYLHYPGGITSLCTLALLNAGVPPDDECIQRALEALRTVRPTLTYSTALQTMVFCAADPKKDLLLIRRNAKWLEEVQTKTGFVAGGWAYPTFGGADNSNTQFAMLALYEAQRAGIPIGDRTWQLALNYWKRNQNPDGSWGYTAAKSGTGSMTTAGITSVIIAAGSLNKGDVEVHGSRVKCCGERQRNDDVEEALNWLARNFSVHGNPGRGPGAAWLLYYLYGVERVGRMTNRRFIGDHDWYREGADMLVRSQDKLSGFWRGAGHAEDNPLIGTSLALLFLAKGRRPVLIAKLKHEPGLDWDHHRSDLANLTAYVEKQWKRDLTWQIIDPAKATADDLLQTPVLFISGRAPPEFSPEEKRNLRDYVDRGGFIFAEACCQGTGFEAGFRTLMTEVFPEPEYRLRLLPPEHPIWHAEEPVNPKYIRPLWGIDLGCRTSVVFCPGDLSCYWELKDVGQHRKLPARVQDEVDAVAAIGINVLAYATNRELRFKYESFTTPTADTADAVQRGRLQVAKLMHPGGCNAAPGALTNLMRLATEKLKIRAAVEPQDVALSDKQVFNYALVFMNGRHSFRFTPLERKNLRTYLERGGVLFVDAICSSRDFAEAFRREMKAIFPEHPLERIPVAHPMFTTAYGGESLPMVMRRHREKQSAGGLLNSDVRQSEPYLEGIKLEDRYAVIFSPYDVSCALEHHESIECEGYTRTDAARIALNVLLYSLHQ